MDASKKKKSPGLPRHFFFLLASFLGSSVGGQLWGNGVGAKKRKCLDPPWTTPAPWVPVGTFSGLLRKRGWENGCEQKEKVAWAAQTLFFLLASFLGSSVGGQLWGNGVGAKKKVPWPSPRPPLLPGTPWGTFGELLQEEGVGKWMRAKRKSRLGCPGTFFFLLASFSV